MEEANIDDDLTAEERAIIMSLDDANKKEQEHLQLQMLGVLDHDNDEERILEHVMMQSIEDAMQHLSVEESKHDQFENMTYEQILEFEEKNGKVSKGLTQSQIRKLPTKVCTVANEDGCVICCCEFERRQRLKFFKQCGHEFHERCIEKWLLEQKKCPVCNQEVKIY